MNGSRPRRFRATPGWKKLPRWMINIRAEPELRKRVRRLARKKGLSIHELIRQMIEHCLEDEDD